MKILVVDDDKEIVQLLEIYIRNEGYEPISAYDGKEALTKLNTNPDIGLIILDLMMPEIDGMDVIKRVRKDSDIPILVLSAKTADMDKIQGLITGADDYVTKPFSNRELVARVKANLRRQAAVKAPAEEDNNTDIQVGDLVIHPEAYTVSKRGENINLTHREFELLHYLAEHIGQVINREHLLQTVWGYDYFGDVRTVDVTVRRLREKIEDNPSHPQWLITRRGVGYYLANPDQN